MRGGRERKHLRGSSGYSSLHRPFSIFMRDIDELAGEKIVNLISQRYITPGKQPDHPLRSYAYFKRAAAYL